MMSVLETDDIEALRAYSEGRIGWRQACKRLLLLDIGELHDALNEHGLPLPDDGQEADDAQTVRRFADFVTKRSGRDGE